MAKGKCFLAERSKPFFILVLAALFIVASASFAFSQTNRYESIKGVKFKDGTVLMGTVTQLNVETLTIRLENGQTVVRKFDDVDTFIKRDDAVTTVQDTKPAVPPAAAAAPAVVPATVPSAAPPTTAPAAAPAAQTPATPPAAAPVAAPAAAPPSAAPAAVKETGQTGSSDLTQQTKSSDTSLTATGSFENRHNSLQFGLMYYYYDYKETLTPPEKSTESGWLPGIYLGYEYKKPSDIYTKLYGHIAGGDLTYDGATQPGNVPLSFDHSHFFFKFEGNIGYTVPLSDKFLLIPYTGYGYRYWRRGESEYVKSVFIPSIGVVRIHDTKEIYTWSYVPIGLKIDYMINDKWSIGGTAAVHFMFGGEMTAYESEWNPSGSDLKFNLGNEPGYYFEIPIIYRFDKNWSMVGKFWYEYSEIGKSNVLAGGEYEPASKTHQYGVNFGVSYLF